jgi:hypothetical protein
MLTAAPAPDFSGRDPAVETFIEQRRASDRMRHRAMAPAAKRLACDLTIGERIFYCGPGQKIPDGHLKYGAIGEVMAQCEPVAASAGSAGRVRVKFRGVKGAMVCYLLQLSREWPPPPLPGGFCVGDVVYFRCASALSDGEHVDHGERGEVTPRDRI